MGNATLWAPVMGPPYIDCEKETYHTICAHHRFSIRILYCFSTFSSNVSSSSSELVTSQRRFVSPRKSLHPAAKSFLTCSQSLKRPWRSSLSICRRLTHQCPDHSRLHPISRNCSRHRRSSRRPVSLMLRSSRHSRKAVIPNCRSFCDSWFTVRIF